MPTAPGPRHLRVDHAPPIGLRSLSTAPCSASEYALPPRSLPQSKLMTRGFLDRPDCRVYFETEGSGPALIFAHGLGGNYMSWWQQVPHFRDRYTCVTFSHRGFAPSLFGLAPGGVCRATPVARRAVGSYPTLSPLPSQQSGPNRSENTAIGPICRLGGLLSVALSLGSPPPDVIRHRVSWSPDFPPRQQSGRLSGDTGKLG